LSIIRLSNMDLRRRPRVEQLFEALPQGFPAPPLLATAQPRRMRWNRDKLGIPTAPPSLGGSAALQHVPAVIITRTATGRRDCVRLAFRVVRLILRFGAFRRRCCIVGLTLRAATEEQ